MTEANKESTAETQLAEALRAAISEGPEGPEGDVTEALLRALNQKKPGGFS